MTELYNKRAMILVTSQLLTPKGGIGTATLSQAKLLNQLGYAVDLILDRPPQRDYMAWIQQIKTKHQIIHVESKDALIYQTHTMIHNFRDTTCWERTINFRSSIIKAMMKHTYDLCLIQSQEALPTVYSMGLHEELTIVLYTHDHDTVFPSNKKDPVFNPSHRPWSRTMCVLPHITIGTQSLRNVETLKQQGITAECLPIPMTEQGLLEPNTKPYDQRQGVLFVGRWEGRKSPQSYIRLIRDTGLPARVMTSSNSYDNFVEELERVGCKDYVVKCDLQGQEKIDFIQSTRVCFMPSREESYGLVVYEAVTCQPVVTIDAYDWSLQHPYSHHYRVDKDDVNDVITQLYNQDVNSLDEVIDWENSIADRWRKLKHTPASSPDNHFIKTFGDDGYMSDYRKSLNNRISINDWLNVNHSRHIYKFYHSYDETWITKTNSPPRNKPSSVNTFTELFDDVEYD